MQRFLHAAFGIAAVLVANPYPELFIFYDTEETVYSRRDGQFE